MSAVQQSDECPQPSDWDPSYRWASLILMTADLQPKMLILLQLRGILCGALACLWKQQTCNQRCKLVWRLRGLLCSALARKSL